MEEWSRPCKGRMVSQRVGAGCHGSRTESGAREIMLKEETSKLRAGGKEKLVRQREEEATGLHTQKSWTQGLR